MVIYFKEHPNIDGIVTRAMNSNNKISLLWRWKSKNAYLQRSDTIQVTTSNLFFRNNVVNNVGLFDETLGPGADTKYGCGEDTDYLIRVFDKGYKIYYLADMTMTDIQVTLCEKELGLHKLQRTNNIKPLSGLTHRAHVNRLIYHPTSALFLKNWPANKFVRLGSSNLL